MTNLTMPWTHFSRSSAVILAVCGIVALGDERERPGVGEHQDGVEGGRVEGREQGRSSAWSMYNYRSHECDETSGI